MPEWFSPVLVEVTDENIGKVCNWLDHLDLLTNLTSYCTSECLSKVNSANQNHEAVYLIAEGDSCTCTPELLREQVFNMRHPLHIVSYECNDVPSLNYMASLCRHTGGRFHAYQNTVRLPEYSATHWDPEQNQAGITICELEYGGWPTSLTQREDCVLIFEELEEARTTLEQIRQILKDVENIPRQCATVLGEQGAGGKTVCQPTSLKNTCGRREEHMSSKEWLECHSLKSQHLGLYETLANVSFKHCDGVVDLLKPPTSDVSLNEDEPLSTDGRDSQYFNKDGKHREKNYSSESSQPAAIVHPKLINARYCDEFVHVLWKDGSLVHVQVTPQLYQLYSRRVKATLTAIQRRIDWLCEGSRELFGTITEDEASVFVQFVS
ncbi:hypothetical protein EG68_10757 [Paragonimus skrjabini miyazakii]|uniref:Uncharacterized protein n=1 Tax=Paragonimus skrjabini miyazakii TaxID=59628 RepID=A0A8S9YJ70_9TREM|nr:hypothetical protein EG68_10757 [Paragonimus skrjabini miyazakii]